METKEINPGRVLVGLVIFAVFLLAARSCLVSMEESAKANPHTPTREELIQKQFSAWNGAHIQLERAIKARLEDPSSFKHVSSTYLDNGDYLLVTMKYRAMNAYGMSVLNTVVARTDISTGTIQEMVDIN